MTRTLYALLFLPILAGCDGAEKPGDDTAVSADVDADGDGVTAETDCDDANADVFPGAVEVCNNLDDDCDGLADEDATDQSTWYLDGDGDGYGNPDSPVTTCDAPVGASETGDDCNDADATVNPGATEVCDGAGVDEDCSGAADDADSGLDTSTGSTWYTDSDGDGYGDEAAPVSACDPADGRSEIAGDCDDTDAAVSPDATEVCDDADVDEDCSGAADDADAGVDLSAGGTWYVDDDGDGYGDPAAVVVACDAPTGVVTDATDCDDTNTDINPGTWEICDADDVDENCDGLADNEDTAAVGQTTFYVDGDADGFGDAATALDACDMPDGYTADATDCDDLTISVYPGADEQCDGIANNCDTVADWTIDLEAGVVSWTDTAGVWTAQTDTFAAGTDAAAVAWTAADDGELRFCAGTYFAMVDADHYTVSITGVDGAELTVLDAAASGPVASVTGGSLTLEGLTLQHGLQSGGGGIDCLAGTLTVRDSVIIENTSTSYGGGIYLQTCPAAIIEGSEVAGNFGTLGGGIYGTTSDGLSVTGSTVWGNEASVVGGGIALSEADFALDSTEVLLNSAGGSYSGGGVWLSNSDGSFNQVAIGANSAGSAGGISAVESALTMVDSSVYDNEAATSAAAMYLYDASSLVASGSLFDGNVSTGSDGVIQLEDNVTADYTDCVFSDNVGADAAMTLANTATATFTDSLFDGNTPYDVYAGGVGVDLSGGTITRTCSDLLALVCE